MENIFNQEWFMREALKEAQKAYELGEVPVGAVVVYENKIIAYYESIIDYSKAIAILSINDDLLIKKIEVSYV